MSKNVKHAVLSGGLCAVSVKRKTKDLAIVAVTDFNKTARIIFDVSERKIIKSNIEFDVQDVNVLFEFLEKTKKETDKKNTANIATES